MTTRDLRRLWKNRARDLNGRARKAGVRGTVSASSLREIVLRDGSACVYCGSVLDFFQRQRQAPRSRTTASFDHFIPLADGGPHLPGNLVCSCAGCNQERERVWRAEMRERRFRFVREAA